MGFLDRKLTRAWQGLFDGSSGTRISDQIPGSQRGEDIIGDNDLGWQVPSATNVLLHDIPVGNAWGRILEIKAGNMNDVGIPSGHEEIKIANNKSTLYIKFNRLNVRGVWRISQLVDRWGTKKVWFVPVPTRERSTKYFKGTFSTHLSVVAKINIALNISSDPDIAPSVKTESIEADIPNFSVKFDGDDNDSKVVAGVVNFIQVINNKLTQGAAKYFKEVIEDKFDLKNKISSSLNHGIERFWKEPV